MKDLTALDLFAFLCFVLIAVAVVAAFTHTGPGEVIPSDLDLRVIESGEIISRETSPGDCAYRDRTEGYVNVWQCRHYLWR